MIKVDPYYRTYLVNDSVASISDFNDNGTGLKEVQFEFLPNQAGSGTPSPDNIRPLSGFGNGNLAFYVGLQSDHTQNITHSVWLVDPYDPSPSPTIYGGKIICNETAADCKVISTMGYIASYNGESLPGKWICDRDVYEEGRIPPTGSQVVYELSTPAELPIYNFSPGLPYDTNQTNDIWSNGNGNIISVTYLVSQAGAQSRYLDAIANGEKQHARITFPFKNVVFEDNDIVSEGIQMNTNVADDSVFKIGTAYSTQVSFSLFKSSKTENINLSNEFRVEFGVEIEGTTEWAVFGYFKGNDIEYDSLNEVYNIIAYDRMSFFDIDFGKFLEYKRDVLSDSILNWFVTLCDYIGIDYETESQYVLHNKSVWKYELKESDIETCRDFLAMIAESAFGCVKINNKGRVLIYTPQTADDYLITLTNDHCFSLYEKSLHINPNISYWKNYENITWGDLFGVEHRELYDEDDYYRYWAIKAVWDDGIEVYSEYPIDYQSMGILYTMSNNILIKYDNEYDIFMYLYMFLVPIIRSFTLPYVVDVSTTNKFCLCEAGDYITKTIVDENNQEQNYKFIVANRVLTWNGSFVCNFSSPKSLV